MDPILGRFLDTVSRAPDYPLIVTGERTVTRGELAANARACAARISDWGLPEGAVVGMIAPPGHAFLNGYVALRMSGLCPLLIDAGTPRGELERTEREVRTAALWWPPGSPGSPGSPESIGSIGEVQLFDGDPTVLPDAALLKLTSGSTGKPLGISVTSEALLADSIAIFDSMGFRRGDRLLAAIPMSHAYGYSILVLPPLIEDLTVVVPRDEHALDAARRHDATIFPSVPSWFSGLTRQSSPPAWPESLRLLISAGAPLSKDAALAFRERFGLPIHVLYGASECGGITYDREGTAAERGSVGTPLNGVEVVIEGADPRGRGTVRVRSASVATAYVPASTEASNRLSQGTYRTDDLGAFEGGELFLHGRRSDWINVKGKKVNPREVETALDSLEGVNDIAVIGHTPKGGGEQVRAIIASHDRSLGYLDVVAWCRDRLAPHKIPRSVILVPELPRNERGKLDRDRLAALVEAATTHDKNTSG